MSSSPLRRPTRRHLLAASALALGSIALSSPALLSRALAQDVQRPRGASDGFDVAPEPFDKGELFDKVIATLHRKYFDPDQFTRDAFVERANSVRPAVVAAPSPEAAVQRINALFAELKASHLALLTPDDLTYYFLLDLSPNSPGAREVISRRFWGNRPHFAGIGAFTAEIDGRHFIDGLLEGSPAARAGLKTGDEIADVDGQPYHQLLSFRGKTGGAVSLGIRRTAEGAIERVRVPVVSIVPRIAFEMATLASTRIIERDGRRIGYFRIWAQMDQRPILQAMARLSPGGRLPWAERDRNNEQMRATTITSDLGALTERPLDAMIVDMRGKIGGTDYSATLLNVLDGGDRATPFVYRGRQGSGSPPPGPRNTPFRGRAAMLIDHHTRSAGEMVAWSFKEARMGPLFGATTRGHVLASQIEVMPGGLILQMPVARPEAEGVILEGKGVAPDVPVPHPLPYSAGADPVLEAALAHLLRTATR